MQWKQNKEEPIEGKLFFKLKDHIENETGKRREKWTEARIDNLGTKFWNLVNKDRRWKEE